MEIRSELEHANYKAIDKTALTDQMIIDLSKEYGFILVCDVSKREDEQERRSYVEALVAPGIITQEQIEGVMADENLVIVIPLHTEHVATEMYRHIKHASHFVSVWVDGKPYDHC